MTTTLPEDVIRSTLAGVLKPRAERDRSVEFAIKQIAKETLVATLDDAIDMFRFVISDLALEFPTAKYQEYFPGDRESKAGRLWPEAKQQLAKAMEKQTGRD